MEKSSPHSKSFKLTRPCCGLFPMGSVRTTAVSNVFVAVANMIIFGAGIIEFLPRYNEEKNPFKRHVRPFFWVAYYLYWICDIYLSLVLYSACRTLNLRKCKQSLWIQIVGFLCFLALYWAHSLWLNGFNIILEASFGVLSLYKVYTFWVVFIFMKWVQQEPPQMKEILSNLSEADLEEFEQGKASREKTDAVSSQNPYYREKFEVNMDHLSDRYTWTLLSKRDSGTVCKAVYSKPGNTPFNVAVKTIRADPAYFKTQLSELKIRTEIEHHENIVGLIGANTTNIRNCELELILELCTHGDLENFLQSVRVQELFVNQLNPNGMFQTGRLQAFNSMDLTLPMTQPVMRVKTVDLVRWSLDVAKGMAKLHTMKIIHGDLAARNVLLTGDGVAKINNFGLSKHHHSYREYAHSKELLAWRSLAPECFIGRLVLSFESDVWAYGVALFEIFSLGERPYSHFDLPDVRFLYAIKNGMIPGRPDFVPNRIYAIMQSCWSLDPKQRPTFQTIVTKLEEFLKPILIDDNCSKPADSDSGVVASDHAIVQIPRY